MVLFNLLTIQRVTLIDVILTTKPESLCDIKVIPTAMSDHDTIGCKRKLNNNKHSPEKI